MKLGSLFDGSGGFPLAGAIHGISPVWASEIEPYPIRVTKARFPQMKHLGSVLDVNGAEIEHVDIITFGSPCQDLSVAGKQAGLHKGERSNLFFEAIRIIKEMLNSTQGEYPKTIIWENVPGAFSSNGGKDIESVLDSIQDLGFVIDMNVLDAQNMGVPQRRRRIYLLGCNVKHIAAMKNFTSWNIITQMLIEILLTILNARLGLSDTEPKNSVWRLRSLTDDGLRRKMKLFSIEGREAFNQLLNNWAETSLTYLNEPSSLECLSKKSDSTEKADTPNGESHNLMEAERLIGSISKSWQNILGESSDLTNSFTTLTAISETTESKIYGCANLLENTQRLIGHFKNCCQVSYETELFISTGRKVCIDYARARQTSGTMFDFMERVHDWDDYLRSTAETEQRFIRNTGAKCEPEVLPLKEGLRGHSAESGTAGQSAAGDAEGSVGRGVLFEPMSAMEENWAESSVKNALRAGASKSSHAVCYDIGEARLRNPQEYFELSPTLTQRCGTGGNNTPAVCYSLDRASFNQGQNAQYKPQFDEDLSATVVSNGPNAVCYPVENHPNDSRNYLVDPVVNRMRGFGDYEQDDTCSAVKARDYKDATDLVVGKKGRKYIIRRLTPLECVRLQGLPDWWLDGVDGSDSAKYKMLGNGIAMPNAIYVIGCAKKLIQEA